MRKYIRLSVLLSTFYFNGCGAAVSNGPFQAMGIKIGEVTDSQAIVWTRLTANPCRAGFDQPMPKVFYYDSKTGSYKPAGAGKPNAPCKVKFPKGSSIDNIEGAVPGTEGMVRVRYRPEDAKEYKSTPWYDVLAEEDHTRQITLTGLKSDSKYSIEVQSQSSDGSIKGQAVAGQFVTAAKADVPQRVVFTVATGQDYDDRDLPERGFKIYNEMLKLKPGFFVHTGDIVYYDDLAKSVPLAQWHWQRMYSLETNVNFHRNVASYFIKDDHDTWMNDCWDGMKTAYMGELTFADGVRIFKQQVPMGKKTWRTFRWGKDVQIWLVEGRDFRSPNNMQDGPEKTIWGKEQKQWFKDTVQASDATFRILISPTPIVGPDRTNKNDNHANEGFTFEGNELRKFIAEQKNMIVICGDRHWQYNSVDSLTGVREYCCGPASNEHAGGWSNDKRLPEHRYLNVTGGFLAGTVERKLNNCKLTLRHYSVDGRVLNEDVLLVE